MWIKSEHKNLGLWEPFIYAQAAPIHIRFLSPSPILRKPRACVTAPKPNIEQTCWLLGSERYKWTAGFDKSWIGLYFI